MAYRLINDVKELRDYIATFIYIKTGIVPYKSKYLTNVVLVGTSIYEIEMTIILPDEESFYLRITLNDNYNHFYQNLKLPIITYDDVDNVLNDILGYIKPSRKY